MSAIGDLLRLRARPAGAGRCGACRHFESDPAAIEAAFPNLASMSSGAASVRADDGLCGLRGRYLPSRASCPDFASRERGGAVTG